MNYTLTNLFKATETLKSELEEDAFEFRLSEMSTILEVIDLDCEEEHADLDKIYTIYCGRDSYSLFFESLLSYKSSFDKYHAVRLIESDIDFEIYKGRLKLSKKDIALEDLAAYVKIMSEILFNF